MTFTLARRVSIDSKGTEFQEYIDDRLGAKHIHVKADTTEMAFMAALPTLPEDDKGAAHILEHMALCGSERFPVRDPFFGMTRRSLSSFMNAMTSADHTVYPFATQDAKDFENLLDVYLDAVFFPTLARHDFLQEGWRHEIKDSALQLHGVVLNEMKGDFSNPVRAAYMGLQSALRPGTTYAVESGGDPLAIPFLTHEELIEFHQAHYHPSRATFYTYGAVDAEAFQATLEARVLSRFAQRLERFSAQMAPSLTSVVSVEIEKPQGADEAEHGFAVAWSVGDRGRDDDAIDEWEFFFAALNADGSSPLARALETAGFGRPGDLMGLETEHAQATLMLSMDGLAAGEVKEARELIFSALKAIAKKGLSKDALAAALRDFEMDCREFDAGHGSTPGIEKLFGMAAVEMNGGDAARALNHEAAMARARASAADPAFGQRMAMRLLQMPGRVEARLTPKANYFPSREKIEKERLRQAFFAMDKRQKQRIEADAADLRQRQKTKPDNSLLPRIHPSEIHRAVAPDAPLEFRPAAKGPSTLWAGADTDGVGHMQLQWDATSLPPEMWAWAELFAWIAFAVGLQGDGSGRGALSYEEAENQRQKAGSGYHGGLDGNAAPVAGQSGQSASRGPNASGRSMSLLLTLEGKTLDTDAGALTRALAETAQRARFNETARVKYLIQSEWQDMRQNLAEDGPHLAHAMSLGSFCALAQFHGHADGVANLRFWERLNELCKSTQGLREIQGRLEAVQSALAVLPTLVSWVGSKDAAEKAFESARAALAGVDGWERPTPEVREFSPESMARMGNPTFAGGVEKNLVGQPRRAVALAGGGQVNHCVMAWQTPAIEEEESALMAVLAAYMENAFVHRAVREQGGAYGGSAHYDLETGVFTLQSFRDPRVKGTFEDFEAAVAFVINQPISEEALAEAIVSVIKTADQIQGAADTARMAIGRAQLGVDVNLRQIRRERVLDCSAEQLRGLAQRHLARPAPLADEAHRALEWRGPARAAFVHEASRQDAESAGLVIEAVMAPKKTPARRAKARP